MTARLALALALSLVLPAGAAEPAVAAPAHPLQPLTVDTASGAHRFRIELMSTDAEREHGLMNRRSLPKDQGMLFDFHVQQPVTFWMKDTYIPLDMVFISQEGRVVAIKHDAKPLDRTLIDSGAPTLGVLELNAGTADAIGLKVGDAVHHAIFHNQGSAAQAPAPH